MRAGIVVAVVGGVLSFVGVARPAQAAPKTDILIFLNGDNLTGEAKGLDHGKLSFNTDATGTIAIEWDDVASLETNQVLQVETSSGLRYLGQSTRPDQHGFMRILYADEPATRDVALADIVRFEPIDQGAWVQRLDGYITAGYDYTKASEVQTFTFSGGVKTRNERRELSLDAATTVTTEKDDEDSNRFSVQGNHRRLLPDRRFYLGYASVQANDALGLDLRTSLGGGYGTYLVQDRRNEWAAFAGLSVNREDFEESDRRDSLEAVLGTTYSFYRFDTPEANVDATLVVLPSLTESGRVRSEATLKSRYEIVEDLFFEISLYGSYDSEPDQDAESDSDYGVTTSVGYSF
jgi:putative salt-induced outer membrane protein YdiY